MPTKGVWLRSVDPVHRQVAHTTNTLKIVTNVHNNGHNHINTKQIELQVIADDLLKEKRLFILHENSLLA